MKHALEEFRVGKWDRFPAEFENWNAADKFLDKLREIYPIRQYRIVPIGDRPPQDAA